MLFRSLFLADYANVKAVEFSVGVIVEAIKKSWSNDIGETGILENTTDSVEEHSCLKGRTVLIVDDDMRNIYSISAILEEKQMNVVLANNGSEALAKLESHTGIEIVLMDIMIPVMNGYDAIAAIRSQEKWKKLPVIALTANALNGTRERCLELGANAYLTKPVNSEQLVNALEVWLSA